MIDNLIIEINQRLSAFLKVPIISQDIEKNTLYPCLKVKIVDHNVELKSQTMIEYNTSISVNYYPKTDVDNRLEFIKIENSLSMIFAFDLGNWKVKEIEIVDNETFITCNLDYNRVDVYEESITLESLNDKIKFVDKNKEYIEEIKLKEELENGK